MAINQVALNRISFTHLVEPHLKGEGRPSRQIPAENPSHKSLSRDIVEWLHASRSFPMQVAVISTVAFAAIALIISCVGIPFVAEVVEENSKYDELERLRILDQPIITLIGGQAAYEQLPILSFDNQDARYGTLPHMQDMRAPIMRGRDKYSRPVLFFKIFDKSTRSSFVEMIYRQYSREGRNNPWVKNPSANTIFGNELIIKGPAIHRLDQVLHGKHNRFALHK